MVIRSWKSIVLFAGLITIWSSCSKDGPTIEPMSNVPEQITTFRFLMFPDFAQPFQIVYRDIDDDGPRAPVIEGATLKTNTFYAGNLSLFDETVIPELDINDVIKADPFSYQIFYVGNGIDFTIDYQDEDGNGNPIGLDADLTTGDTAADGSITIIVRHMPAKNSSNDPVSAGGTTVAEVTIPLNIEE